MNRFHGEDWPCSPARLFRALLAGSMTGGNRDSQTIVEPALRWLERLPAPEIDAVSADPGDTYRISVPNNDMDIAAWEWASGRQYDPSILRTMKTVVPKRLSGEGPHVTFRWTGIEMEPAIEEGLRAAVHSLHTLGWGIDMAFADMAVNDSKPAGSSVRWRPSELGSHLLALPVEGSLDDLKATYARFLNSVQKGGVNPDTRPSVYRFQTYSNGYVAPQAIVFELAQVGGKEGIASFPPEKTMEISAWLRHAVSTALAQEKIPEQTINEIALGHNDTEVNTDRIVYIPMPSIGFAHAGGGIRRVMIAMRRRPDLLDLLRIKLNGWELTDKGGNPKCRLTTPSNPKVKPFYVDARREWASVTPVILHGYNSAGGNISMRKTDKLLAQAFAQAGHEIDNIEEWTIQAAPFWPGTPGARSMRVPKHLERWPRYHVSVKFRDKIGGPVLAGIGRHYGLGVFAGLK